MRADVVLQIDVVVLPNDQNVPLCQTGKGVELLWQRAEAAGDAVGLPAIAGFVFQLAGIVEDDQLPAIRWVVLRDEARNRVGHHLRLTVRGAQTGNKRQLTGHQTPPHSIFQGGIHWNATGNRRAKWTHFGSRTGVENGPTATDLRICL